jgi:vesicle coat complex subunit
MIDNRVKKDFLKQLEETGNVFRTCRRVGIPYTSTVYRWAENNQKFKKQMEEAQRIGRLNAVDIAEGGMVNKASEGDYKSQVFLLRHLSATYKPQPRQVNIEHKRSGDKEEEFEIMKREQWNQITEAWKRILESVRNENMGLSEEDTEEIIKNVPDLNITTPDEEIDDSADQTQPTM